MADTLGSVPVREEYHSASNAEEQSGPAGSLISLAKLPRPVVELARGARSSGSSSWRGYAEDKQRLASHHTNNGQGNKDKGNGKDNSQDKGQDKGQDKNEDKRGQVGGKGKWEWVGVGMGEGGRGGQVHPS